MGLKSAWDECYPEFRHRALDCLRDNSGRFKSDKTINNEVLVENREQLTEQPNVI